MKSDVRIDARPDESNMPGFLSVLISWFPMLLFIGVWIFFMRQMQGGGKGGALGFGKSRAKMLTEHQGRVTFEDVAGIDEAKTELEEVVEFLKDPRKIPKTWWKNTQRCPFSWSTRNGKNIISKSNSRRSKCTFFYNLWF